jgi:hypothetical protein
LDLEDIQREKAAFRTHYCGCKDSVLYSTVVYDFWP